MNLRISYFSRPVFKNDFRRYGLIGIIYFIWTGIATNFAMVYGTVPLYVEDATVASTLNVYYPNAIDMFLVFLVPLFLGVALF